MNITYYVDSQKNKTCHFWWHPPLLRHRFRKGLPREERLPAPCSYDLEPNCGAMQWTNGGTVRFPVVTSSLETLVDCHLWIAMCARNSNQKIGWICCMETVTVDVSTTRIMNPPTDKQTNKAMNHSSKQLWHITQSLYAQTFGTTSSLSGIILCVSNMPGWICHAKCGVHPRWY